VQNNSKFDFNNIKTPYFIAEVGVNNCGDLQKTKKLIDAAYSCGWDCVKFQKRTPDLCVPEDQKQKPKDTPWGIMPYIDYRKITEFDKLEYDYIDKYCREKPIDWTVSVWDLPSLHFILQYEVPFIKIPSAHLHNIELLTEAARSGIHLILSTGMSSIEEIEVAVSVMEKESCSFSLLQCNSAYPAMNSELDIRFIPKMKELFSSSSFFGYSGHDVGIDGSLVSITLGADIIEKHITLDKESWGSDQSNSLEISEMDLLIRKSENIIAGLGAEEKVLYKSGEKDRNRLRGKK